MCDFEPAAPRRRVHGVDVTELEQRASAAVAALRQLAAISARSSASRMRPIWKRCVTSMLRAATSAWPAPCRFRRRAQRGRPPDTDRAGELHRVNEVARRVAQLDALTRAARRRRTGRDRDRAALRRLRIVFGEVLRRAARASPRPTPTNSRSALGDSDEVQDDDPLAALDLVRSASPRARRRRPLRRGAHAMPRRWGTASRLTLSVAQLPHRQRRALGRPCRSRPRSRCRRQALARRASCAPLDPRSRSPGSSSTSGSRSCPNRARRPASRSTTTSRTPRRRRRSCSPCRRTSTQPWTSLVARSRCCSRRSTSRALRAVDPRRRRRGRPLPAGDVPRASTRPVETVVYRFHDRSDKTGEATMASITTWTRLEPRCRDARHERRPAGADLRSALAAGATVADRASSRARTTARRSSARWRGERRRSRAITPAPLAPKRRRAAQRYDARTCRSRRSSSASRRARPERRARARGCARRRCRSAFPAPARAQERLAELPARCSSPTFRVPAADRRRSARRSTPTASPIFDLDRRARVPDGRRLYATLRRR